MISDLGDQLQILTFTRQAGPGTSDSHKNISQLQYSSGGIISDRQDSQANIMADLNSSLESSGLSAEETTTASTSRALTRSCETMIWEGWTTSPHDPSNNTTGDEELASTSNNGLQPLLELAKTTTTSSTSGNSLSFHQQSDMLSTMFSGFHPLAYQHPQIITNSDHNAGFSDSELATVNSLGDKHSKSLTFLSGIPCPLPKRVQEDDDLSPFDMYAKTTSPWDAPSPIQHDVPWPERGPETATIQLFHEDNEPTSAHIRNINNMNNFAQAQTITSKSKLERFDNLKEMKNPNGIDQNSMLSMPATTWTTSTAEILSTCAILQSERESDQSSPSTRSQPEFLNFVPIAPQEQRSVNIMDSDMSSVHVNPGAPRIIRNRQQQELPGCDELLLSNGQLPKRPHLVQVVDEHAAGALWQNHNNNSNTSNSSTGLITRVVDNSSCRSSGGVYMNSGSQAMELFAIGPALNTNGKPRARRGSATDPQSVYARHRREKINERLKTLQHLVPNGTKVDIVTMLDEAIHYIQFLQLQVKLLKSDKYWIHATPNTYNGIDLTNPPIEMQQLGSSA